MKGANIQIGGVYAAKVSGKIVHVRISSAASYVGWYATNMSTGRIIHIRSAARLRYPILREEKP